MFRDTSLISLNLSLFWRVLHVYFLNKILSLYLEKNKNKHSNRLLNYFRLWGQIWWRLIFCAVVEPKEGPVMVDRVYPVIMMHSPAAAQWV